nr:MAG: putative structural protein [Salisharnavirus sp.]
MTNHVPSYNNLCPDCKYFGRDCWCAIVAPQSGMEMSADGTTDDNRIMRLAGDQKQENVRFSDQVDPYLYDVDSVIDPTRKLQDSNDATLQNFFSRPIKIAEQEWATSTTLGFDINPWELYFENPRVANRLSNFNLMRAKLHIKVVINGNGFQYGRALVSYLPFDVFDSLSSNSALIRQDLVQASQQPRIFLDPTTSQGGEMILPFYNYWNYCSIPNSQWEELGQLYFRSLNLLKHANGANDVVTISVFAWAEDVEMSVLTSVDQDNISPQSGTEVDEVNQKGTISGPATSIAKVAGAMTSVPMIGPFAQATEMAATTTAAIAKMFGYCRPPITKAPDPLKPNPAAPLALTNVGDGPTKLTIDDKQELSVDPRIAGLGGVDSLNIKEIAKRESYLTTFDWNIGTAPETLLWNARVDPCTWAESPGPPTSYHFPACAMAALPFRYWTGTMRFRFQIVCSAFHKGRIKVVYDPNYFNSNEYNTNYLTVVDIADKTDFTVEIANGQDYSLLNHAFPGNDSVTTMYSTTPYTSRPSPVRGNGVVGVYVVNELTTPNSTINNDIEVNVFVSMGDDFEVFVPDDHFQYFVAKPQTSVARVGEESEEERDDVRPQSGMEAQSGALVSESQNTTEPSAPQQEVAEELGPTMSDNSDLNKVFTGESIASFRTMLKRYNLWTSVSPLNSQSRVLSGRYSMFPFLRGEVNGAVHETLIFERPYNFCNTVLLHWVTWAFSGWRGSIRYKWLLRGRANIDERLAMYVQRHPIGQLEYVANNEQSPQYATTSQAAQSVVVSQQIGGLPRPNAPLAGVKGQMYQSGYVNPAVEFELPYYSPFRFTPGKEENHTELNLFNEGYDYYLQQSSASSGAYDIHVAAGEDFQLYFFTGLPRLYFEPTPPEPDAT